MIDFSPEAWDRDRRGVFPEGGRHLGRLGTKAPAARGHRGRTFPATYTSTPNSTLPIIVLHKDILFIKLEHKPSLKIQLYRIHL